MTISAKGGLFKNQHKNSDNHPDYRGDFKITQELLDALQDSFSRGHDKVQLAGWKKEGRDGKAPFLSINVSPPYEKPGEQKAGSQQSRPQPRAQELNDDIPSKPPPVQGEHHVPVCGCETAKNCKNDQCPHLGEEAVTAASDYPAIAKLVRRVKCAPHGQKRAIERSLVKARLASLKREIKAGKVAG